MDYEKLHKDTITKLQEMVNSGKITAEEARGICADFVPESEDERIRKELINYLDNFTNSEDRELVDKFIAWLEAQGEQKQEWSEEDEKEIAAIEHHLNNCGASVTSILWLKSLRPPYYCDSCKLKKSIEKSTLDIEIPFGAKDSELIEETISIPNGCYAVIKGNQVIIRKLQAKRLKKHD